MKIVPKGRIIARSNRVLIRKVISPSPSFLLLTLEKMLLQCGWERTINRIRSQPHDLSVAQTILVAGEMRPFEARLYVEYEAQPTSCLFYLDSIYDLSIQDRTKPIKLNIQGDYWIVVCPYQFFIFPDIALGSVNRGVFISSLKLPSFARDNPWLQAICCVESERLLNDYLTQDFNNKVRVAVLQSNGSVYEWNDTPGAGQVLFYRLGNDSGIATRINSGLKSPVFTGWGTFNKFGPASIKGFAWDLVFIQDHEEYQMHKSYIIDRNELFMLSRHQDNVLALQLRYGIPANAQ